MAEPVVPPEPLPRIAGPDQLAWWQARYRALDYVYAIQGAPGTPVKIGHSKTPLRRLRTLQTGSHDTLRLLHVVPGDRRTEQILHEWFAEWRHRDEWFSGPRLDLMLEMLDALAHHQIRDADAYRPEGRYFWGSYLPPLATIHSRAEVAATRPEIRDWWNNGFNAESIAQQIGWQTTNVDRELRLMGRDPAYNLRPVSGAGAYPLQAEHRVRTGRARNRRAAA